MRLLYLILIMLLVILPVYAGTFRDDFENEEDFLKDKQLREGGVWGDNIAFFTWENGAVKGQNTMAGFFVTLHTGDYGWKDYTIECKIKWITGIADVNFIGLVLRHGGIGSGQGYFFELGANNSLICMGDNNQAPMKSVPYQPNKDAWYALKAVAQGEQLELFIDNKLFVEVEDNVYTAGKAGFVISNGRGGPVEALFDDFVMTGPEVKDGGHWDPEAHPQSKAVSSYDKLANTWGNIKYNR